MRLRLAENRHSCVMANSISEMYETEYNKITKHNKMFCTGCLDHSEVMT